MGGSKAAQRAWLSACPQMLPRDFTANQLRLQATFPCPPVLPAQAVEEGLLITSSQCLRPLMLRDLLRPLHSRWQERKCREGH